MQSSVWEIITSAEMFVKLIFSVRRTVKLIIVHSTFDNALHILIDCIINATDLP